MRNARSALRSVADWAMGPRLQDRVACFWGGLSPARFPENRALSQRHSEVRRCFVIGNGPSLAQLDLRPLAHEYTIGANSFYKHPNAAEVGLHYLCIFDPHFMTDEPRSVDWHRTLVERTPTASFLLHESARRLVDAHGIYEGRDVNYVASGYPARDAKLVRFDLSRPLNVGMTTGSAVAIPLAVCLGFKEIYLVGFDCNWLESRSGSYHFYQTHEHFPEFDSVDADGRGSSYEDELRLTLREFESHRLIRDKARSLGVRIVNATAGGVLDVYERRPFADCFRD